MCKYSWVNSTSVSAKGFGAMLWRLIATALVVYAFVGHPAVADEVSLHKVDVPIRHVDYRFALKKEESGLRRFDWKTFKERPRKIIVQDYPGLLLENDALRVTLILELGRVHSIVNKATGNELLWINPCALPLGANNDTGFWMTWGGMERVLPRLEHGTTHAMPWDTRVVSQSDQQVTVSSEVTEPLTGLRLKLLYSLYANKNYLETVVVVENPTDETQRFSHWTTAVLSPGGLNEVTADTELIFPAERFIPDDRDFNDWMEPMVGPTATSPLRKVGNWKSIGDLMTSPLQKPYYAVYCNEKREGVVHTFDLVEAPVVDVWGWGFPASPARQREFTAGPPNRGYIEVWNGNVHGFKDDSLATLEPGGLKRWRERTFAVENLEPKRLSEQIEKEASKVISDAPARTSEDSSRASADPHIERTVIAHGQDDYDWFQTRAAWIPAPYRKPLLLLQQKTRHPSHGYYNVYQSLGGSTGTDWQKPSLISALKRIDQEDGYQVSPGDLWPTYHAASGKVIATGKTFNFRDGKHEDILVPEEGRALGNSGVCPISDHETWVVVGEGAPAKGIPWTRNRVILAKVQWPQRN